MFDVIYETNVYKYTFVSAVIACGFFIGFSIVGKFVYPTMIDNPESEDYLTEEEKAIEKYIKLYNEEYESLEDVDMDDDEISDLKNCFLTETTPLGVIKMYYCDENESYIYWCEKQIPYKVLEAVSKKYSIEYNCKYIHVDMEHELKNKREQLMNSTNDRIDASGDASGNVDASGNASGKVDANDSVFVTFKKYNTSEHVNDTKKSDNKKNKKEVIVCEKANRYSYRGPYVKVEDKPDKGECNVKNISFTEFMKAKSSFSSNNSGIIPSDDSGPASDGFWRFLDINYVADDMNIVKTDDKKKGFFKMNGVEFSDLDKYHKAVMEELKATVSCNNSDVSYDVLECETDSGLDNANDVRDLSNAIVDSDEEPEILTSSNDVQSGKRISRRESIDSADDGNSDDKKTSSWGFGIQW